MMSEAHQYLYVIGAIEDNIPVAPCKIGITRSLNGRLASLQTGNPKKLEIISAVILPTREIVEIAEKVVHWQFEDFRLVGEWFDVNPVDAAIGVCTLCREIFLEIGLSDGDAMKALDNLGIVREIRKAFEYVEHCKQNNVPLQSRFMELHTTH